MVKIKPVGMLVVLCLTAAGCAPSVAGRPNPICAGVIDSGAFFSNTSAVFATRVDFNQAEKLRITEWRSDKSWPVIRQIDLLTGQAAQEAVTPTQPFGGRCRQGCEAHVIAESPDHKWQIVRVSRTNQPDRIPASLAEARAAVPDSIWLMSEASETLLSAGLPAGLEWSWSQDSSLLWYTAATYESGAMSKLLRLEGASVTGELSVDSNMAQRIDPASSITLLLPDRKQLLAARLARDGPAQPREQVQPVWYYRLSPEPPRLALQRAVTGLVALGWDEATQAPLFAVAGDESLLIQMENGATVATIPLAGFRSAHRWLADLHPENQHAIPPLSRFVLSPSRRYVAFFGLNPVIFSCAPARTQ